MIETPPPTTNGFEPTPAHPAEAAAAGSPAAAIAASRATSLGTLLGSHVLRDGELVLLILKPSLWFIVFNSLAFTLVTAFLAAALALIDHRMHDYFYFEAGLFVIAGRFMWSMLEWMGRLYILTDQRVLRITGIFSVEVFDCPLRKVVRARMVSTSREKVVGVGSIEIIPADEAIPSAIWQTIAKPKEILERLRAAITRAKQSGIGAG
jgi:Bacterial PH domain